MCACVPHVKSKLHSKNFFLIKQNYFFIVYDLRKVTFRKTSDTISDSAAHHPNNSRKSVWVRRLNKHFHDTE